MKTISVAKIFRVCNIVHNVTPTSLNLKPGYVFAKLFKNVLTKFLKIKDTNFKRILFLRFSVKIFKITLLNNVS